MSTTEADKTALDKLVGMIDDDRSSIESVHIVLNGCKAQSRVMVQATSEKGSIIAAVANDRLSECAKMIEKCVTQAKQVRTEGGKITLDPIS